MEAGKGFKISRAIKDSFAVWLRNFPLIAGLTAPYALLTALVMPHSSIWAMSGIIGPWITALLWGVGRREKGLPAGLLSSLVHGLRLWPRFLGLGMMISLCWLAGLLCLVLPVLYAMTVVSVAPALAFAEEKCAEESLTQSYDLTRPHFLRIMAYWAVMMLIAFVTDTALVMSLEGSGMVEFANKPNWTAGNWLAWLYPYLLLSSLPKLGGISLLKQLLASTSCEPSEGPGVGLNPSA